MRSHTTLYDEDFYAWTKEQAALLRLGAIQDLDLTHLAEEIESLGKSEMRALESHLEVLLLHLLKWQYQPGGRLTGHSWYDTIVEQRRQIARLLRDNHTFHTAIPQVLDDVYPSARQRAAVQMGEQGPLAPPHERGPVERRPLAPQELVRRSLLPQTCPWKHPQVLDPDFWPGEAADTAAQP